MSSRSATVLAFFIVAIIAFCLACVFASMTGPISILPNESDSGGILDDLSAITNGSGDSGDSYGDQYSNDYSSSNSYSSYSNVETTSDDSSSSSSSSQHEDSNVETTTDNPSNSPDVETTVG